MFFKAYPWAAALGHPIPLLSFPEDLTSRAASSCSGSSSDSEKSVRGLPSSRLTIPLPEPMPEPIHCRSQNSIASPHLSRYIYKLFPRGERKLQDEYVLPGFPNSFSS